MSDGGGEQAANKTVYLARDDPILEVDIPFEEAEAGR